MDESRILIIGANGQLGTELKARYPKAAAADRDSLDISNKEAVAAFDWSAYDIILNAAAYTKVDDAETPEGRKLAWAINASAVGYLSEAATEHHVTLVHVSSDYVFDGTLSPHTEEEAFAPLGVYGQSKAAGDIAAACTPKHYILRTSWVIGEGKNFVRTMMGLAAKNISPTVVSDQIGRLTFTKTLTDAIDHLLRTRAPYGTYNLSNDGEPASWADITREIFAALGRNDLAVTNTSTADYFAGKPGIAPRPLQSTLSLDKIKSAGLTPREWRADLIQYIEDEQAKDTKE